MRIGYADIPGFHVPTVVGHKGELVAGTLGGEDVITQSGRFHMYEGHPAQVSALPVRVFAVLGVTTLIVTNAAGGIRRTFSPGTLMLISDHINLTGRNPLEGAVLAGETRFPDMTVAYDAELRDVARRVAHTQGTRLEEGVYVRAARPHVRDARRSADARSTRCRCRGDEHGAGDDRRARARDARAGILARHQRRGRHHGGAAGSQGSDGSGGAGGGAAGEVDCGGGGGDLEAMGDGR